MTESWAEGLERLSLGGVSPRRDEFRRIGFAVRRIIESVVTSKAPDEKLEEIADQIESLASTVEQFPRGRIYEGFAEAANTGANGGFLDFSPVSGGSNPIAPPVYLSVELDEDETQFVLGIATFGAAYEGPPGVVHGGYLAAAFDEVLGLAQSLGGSSGMTANLNINYKQPTPLGRPLRFEARIVKIEGRKVFTKGLCYAGETLTAEAEGLFISVDFSKLIALAMQREGDSAI